MILEKKIEKVFYLWENTNLDQDSINAFFYNFEKVFHTELVDFRKEQNKLKKLEKSFITK